MVNEFSASASEIFAAAMQDYDRGVVVGSTSTYGKGTVQRNLELRPESSLLSNNESAELGTIKLTLQKFYRINGGSTQLKGVAPHIVLPDQYETLKYREKDNPDAMAWDEIQKASYIKSTPNFDLESLKLKSAKRVQENASFNAISEISTLIEKSNLKTYSLNFTKYRDEQKILREGFKKIEETNKTQKALTVTMLGEDEKKLAVDKDKLERRKQWINNLSKDLYLSETTKIVTDMINNEMIVRKN
jgi:carboxyl-terminal processing protease